MSVEEIQKETNDYLEEFETPEPLTESAVIIAPKDAREAETCVVH